MRPPPCSDTGAAPPAAWLDFELASVPENLALDELLLEAAHAGLLQAPVVRAWVADEPTVVLGSSSRLAEEIDATACAAAGLRIVRRPSGGLTVVLGPGCVMWSVIAPHPAGSPLLDAIHESMLEPLAAALRAAGRPVERRGTSDLAVIGAAGEERKVSGNALRVRRHGVLYHGTLLDAFDLDLVSRVLRHPPREPAYRAGRPHGTFLANLALGRRRLEEALRTAFTATERLDAWPLDRVGELVRDRYASPDWTGRL